MTMTDTSHAGKAQTMADDLDLVAKKWAEFMGIDAPFTIQHGSFDGLPEEAKATGAEFGATFSSPSNDEFIVCISDECPPERLEQVLVHELVHVHTFSQSGSDVREAMETATELAAGVVIRLEKAEAENARLRGRVDATLDWAKHPRFFNGDLEYRKGYESAADDVERILHREESA